MAAVEYLPWQAALWAQLRVRMEKQELPHALLLSGLPGLGKRQLATALARALLCDRPGAEAVACGDCRACRLAAQGAHPDLFVLEPEEEGKQIRIDQVRDLIGRLSLKSQYGRYRIGLIDPADSLNTAAANALLKTLEEPPAGVLLLLTAARPTRLPATIRSRCQQLILTPPTQSAASEWLRAQRAPAAEKLLGLALGAPLRAIELQANGALERWQSLLSTLELLRDGRLGVVAAAAEWRESGRDLIPQLLAVCADLARLGVGGAARYDTSDRLRTLAAGLDLSRLHAYVEQLLEQRRHLEHPLNEQLVLESAFAGWQEAAGKSRPADRLA